MSNPACVIRTLRTSITFAGGPNLLMRQPREPLIDQASDRADAEAVCGEQRLRRAVAACGREHGQRSRLVGTEARFSHRDEFNFRDQKVCGK